MRMTVGLMDLLILSVSLMYTIFFYLVMGNVFRKSLQVEGGSKCQFSYRIFHKGRRNYLPYLKKHLSACFSRNMESADMHHEALASDE